MIKKRLGNRLSQVKKPAIGNNEILFAEILNHLEIVYPDQKICNWEQRNPFRWKYKRKND